MEQNGITLDGKFYAAKPWTPGDSQSCDECALLHEIGEVCGTICRTKALCLDFFTPKPEPLAERFMQHIKAGGWMKTPLGVAMWWDGKQVMYDKQPSKKDWVNHRWHDDDFQPAEKPIPGESLFDAIARLTKAGFEVMVHHGRLEATQRLLEINGSTFTFDNGDMGTWTVGELYINNPDNQVSIVSVRPKPEPSVADIVRQYLKAGEWVDVQRKCTDGWAHCTIVTANNSGRTFELRYWDSEDELDRTSYCDAGELNAWQTEILAHYKPFSEDDVWRGIENVTKDEFDTLVYRVSGFGLPFLGIPLFDYVAAAYAISEALLKYGSLDNVPE